MVVDFVREFLYEYFVVPGYDIVDTPTYGILLGILVLYAVIPLVKRLDVSIGKEFIKAISPFIVFGATARELVDRHLGVYALAGDYPANFYLVSPWIFFTMFILTVMCVAAGLAVQKFKGIPYHKTLLLLGSLLMLYNIFLILANLASLLPAAVTLLAFSISLAILRAIARARSLGFLRNEGNIWIVAAHLLDASATFVGVDLMGHVEQHVLPNYLIDWAGTALIMYPLKLLVVVPALFFIDRELADDEVARRMIKIVVLVLGLGPALRDISILLLG